MSIIIRFPELSRNDVILTAISDDNEYIPANILATGQVITLGDKKTFIYSFERPSTIRRETKYAEFCNSLLNNPLRRGYGSGYTELRHVSTSGDCYRAINHSLIYTPSHISESLVIPLIVLAVKKQFLFEIDASNPDPSKFCLLINNKFITDERCFKVYRNIKKHYIEKVENDIDILYTNNIMNLCYNDKSLQLPQFNTVEEMTAFHSSIANQAIMDNLQAVQ